MKELKDKIILFLSQNSNIILLSIILIAFIIRLYYFNMNQGVWWDEGEYLTRAKYYAGSLISDQDLWSPRRPFLLIMLWAFIYKLGGTEIYIKLTELIFSIFGVYFTYLVGKEMYGKKTGIIAALGMSVVNLHLFLTARMLIELPAVTMSTLAIYTFYKYYIKEQTSKYLWLTGLLMGIAGFIRASTVLVAIPIIAIILINERINFIKNKNIWKMAIAGFLTLFPYLIYLANRYHTLNVFKKLTGIGEGRFNAPSEAINQIAHLKEYFLLVPYELKLVFTIFLIVGLFLFINLFLGFDLLINNKEKGLQRELLLFIWAIIYVLFFGLFSPSYSESRYFMYSFPAFFIIAGQGLEKITKLVYKINKNVIIIAITIILIIGLFSQINYGDNLIKSKAYSFAPLNPLGTWIKENSNKNEIMLSNSNQMEIMYYAERRIYGVAGSEKDIFEAVEKYKPKYIIISTLFPDNPVWQYQYPQKYPEFLTPVFISFYDQEQKQPAAGVYEINYKNFKLEEALKKVNPEWTAYD